MDISFYELFKKFIIVMQEILVANIFFSIIIYNAAVTRMGLLNSRQNIFKNCSYLLKFDDFFSVKSRFRVFIVTGRLELWSAIGFLDR